MSRTAVSASNEAMELHPYARHVLEGLRARAPWEIEFLQAVEEVFTSISPMLERHPVYQSERILERMTEPDRTLGFRVVWTDRNEVVQVARGYRVQFNNALGPYKGGTRFHPSVDLGSLKFLAFEQTFKNALTGLSLGSGKGGADFQSRGSTDREAMRFCQSYMTELHKHIGPEIDVPAGDIGVGGREIGYMFGHYKRLSASFSGVLTGKGTEWGGSALRPEATGFGVVYFAEEVLRTMDESIRSKRVAISGFGQVAWGVARKVSELGGTVVTLSGPDGFIHDPDGVRGEKIEHMLGMRSGGRDEVRSYAERFGVEFHPGKRPWGVPCDVAIPCAIQNELELADADDLVKGGCRLVVEGANMPTTADAAQRLQNGGIVFVPGKAANAGGVAVSGLEMTQNRTGRRWSPDEVDAELHIIMARIHSLCRSAAARYEHEGDYVVGANIGGFARVADAMLDQGLV